jgi:hypothetical protein
MGKEKSSSSDYFFGMGCDIYPDRQQNFPGAGLKNKPACL